jgi:acyl-CoA synthetase (AMP-forming)/AMP-acid ligase II
LDEDGYLVLVDRKKDLIICGGENISPAEVESVLERHSSVAQAAVVGRPDAVMGEEPVAFIVPSPGCAVDEATLHTHCRQELAAFKVPRAFYGLDALPRNAVGKVTKDVLRARFISDEVVG